MGFPGSEAADLTICTVAFDSGPWLEANRQLLMRLNPGQCVRWVVAENSPTNSSARLPENHPFFEVVPGAPFVEMPHASASHHHGAGMNLAVQHVATRYALILDPDFFIIRPDWISGVLRYMQSQRVAILGVPWHPSRTRKLRYFPCPHCMFLDLGQVDRAQLDFTPGPGHAPSPQKGRFSKLDPMKLHKRRFIGTSRDTGWRVYDRYGDDSDLRVECLQGVLRPSRLSVYLETPLPDRLRFVPRRAGYFTTEGFRERGLQDLESLRWEEWMWQERPFGFHIRCFPKLSSGESAAFHREKLRQFLDSLPNAPAAGL